ncbi:polyadenylate-binding protein 2-like [Homarus americanus]|uniref:Polyadenylate-binding protein 2-like 2 n=1 Tax=Homarus americanus TaxID=6706 RepID=A0A8J5MQC5_HOMAM|nr:polyadenylate-binding protein 2-like [Homarus americanus]KAG7159815.1 Polyadenylate-binding protein 2-like 2 [Homarus americanus]
MDHQVFTHEDLITAQDFGQSADIDFSSVKPELKKLLREAHQVRRQVNKEVEKMKNLSQVCPRLTPTLPSSEEDGRSKVDAHCVYVGNIDGNITEEDLKEHFLLCGIMNTVNIVRKSKGKGFAYILFRDKFSVDLALTLNDCCCKGVKLKVEPKQTGASTGDRPPRCSSKNRRRNQPAGTRRL